MHALLLPEPPPFCDPPVLTGHLLRADGRTWHIEVLGIWRACEGLFPDLDFLCRLTSVSDAADHSVMFEVDRRFLHMPNAAGAIVKAVERAIGDRRLPVFVRIDTCAKPLERARKH